MNDWLLSWMNCFSPSCRALPRFSALASAILAQAADLAALVPALDSCFSLESAEGVQLDVLAACCGIRREDVDAAGATDEQLRAWLRAKQARWRWNGTSAAAPSVLAEAFPGREVRLRDGLNQTVSVSGAPPGSAELLPVPAGVRIEWEEE